MFDLGDTVTLVWPGVPAAALTVTMTITQPDATVVGPFTVTPVAGTATYLFVPPQVGRYAVQWLSTGTGAAVQSYTDAFDVAAADAGFIISLTDVKSQLNMTSSANDEELRMWLRATTDLIENLVGSVVPRTYTEVHNGGLYTISTFHAPIISVTSVTEYIGFTAYPLTLQPYGSSTSAYGYSIDNPNGGTLSRRTSAGFPFPFQGTSGSVTITYTAGLQPIPAAIQAAARLIVQDMWASRRGAMAIPAQGGAQNTTPPGPGFGSNIPDNALILLEHFERTSGIA